MRREGAGYLGMAGTLTTLGYARGGTHMIAHACHQILMRDGCKFFTHSEVTKVLHDGVTATGIELADGTRVGARKLVVSAGLSAWQLLEIVGREVFGEEICRKVDTLSTSNIGWLLACRRRGQLRTSLQLLQDHRVRHGSGQAVGGAG